MKKVVGSEGRHERTGDQRLSVPLKKHQFTLKQRESLTVEGVVNVESFDDEQVHLETEQGMMTVRGDGIHIKELNLDGGSLQVQGFVRSIEYTGDGPRQKDRAKGILGKLFK